MNVETILKSCIYTIEKKSMGQTIIMGIGLEKITNSEVNITYLSEHLIQEINNSLVISQKYGNETSNVHLYLKGCALKSFSLSVMKKIIKILNDTFDDTLNYCYIYDLSTVATMTWNILRFFVDPITRKKILIVKTLKN